MNILGILGGIIYLYLVWRNLRNNYKGEDLVVYGWWSILGFLVVGRLASGLINWGVWSDNWTDWLTFWSKPGFSYAGGVIGWALASWWWVEKYQWKIWAFFEDVVTVEYIFLGWLMLVEAIKNKLSLRWLTLMMVWVVEIALVGLIKKKYRSFSWYVSGKKGFAFFFANFFLGIMLSAWFYLVAQTSIILSSLWLTISVSSVIGLFILGEVGGKK